MVSSQPYHLITELGSRTAGFHLFDLVVKCVRAVLRSALQSGATMGTLKGIGGWLAGFAVIVAIFFVISLLFTGVAYVSGIVMPWLATAAQWMFAFALIILLPATFFRATRVASAYGFLLASFVFGLCAWIFGFLVTYTYWGLFGVFLGLVFVGVGVVPVGLLAAVFHSEWHSVWILLQYAGLTIGCRFIMFMVATKADRDAEERDILTLEAK